MNEMSLCVCVCVCVYEYVCATIVCASIVWICGSVDLWICGSVHLCICGSVSLCADVCVVRECVL